MRTLHEVGLKNPSRREGSHPRLAAAGWFAKPSGHPDRALKPLDCCRPVRGVPGRTPSRCCACLTTGLVTNWSESDDKYYPQVRWDCPPGRLKTGAIRPSDKQSHRRADFFALRKGRRKSLSVVAPASSVTLRFPSRAKSRSPSGRNRHTIPPIWAPDSRYRSR
jgi:hypothetical protein